MFPTWRLRLREARLAFRGGRYEEAGALLRAGSLYQYLPAKQLASDVASRFVERAASRLASGDSVAGWNDLARADQLGGSAEALDQVKAQYRERCLQEIVRYLARGQAAAAQARLKRLQQRGLAQHESPALSQIARLVEEAQEFAARGHFAEAAERTRRAADLGETHRHEIATMNELTTSLGAQASELASQAAQCQELAGELHAALAAENWSLVLAGADRLLALAPRHAAAAEARRRAWRAVGMDVTQPYYGRRPARDVALDLDRKPGRGARRSTRRGSRSSEDDTVAGSQPPNRSLLWIDAVGGFLVCADDRIVLGQPSQDNIALPILADLSRRHAVLRREAGAYLLEPIQQVAVNGRPLTGPHVLADGDRIQLGSSVRLRFARPHALSATARLTLESHHKTQPSADAVLLMADSIVLGPNRHCHVQCRDWKHDVVIYRQDDKLWCRSSEPLTQDGRPVDGVCQLEPAVRVEGEAISFTWETVE